MSASVGAPTVADMVVGVTGQSFNFITRNSIAPNDTVQPSGLSITSEQGTAIGISSQEAQLTGQSITSSLGTVTIPNNVAQISGVSAEFTFRIYCRIRRCCSSTIKFGSNSLCWIFNRKE